MPYARIKIDAKGQPTILDVPGAKKACGQDIAQFEAMIGTAKEDTRTRTDSYYEGDEESVEQSHSE